MVTLDPWDELDGIPAQYIPCLLGHRDGDLSRFQIYSHVERVVDEDDGDFDIYARALCPAAVAKDVVVSIVASSIKPWCGLVESFSGGLHSYLLDDGE